LPTFSSVASNPEGHVVRSAANGIEGERLAPEDDIDRHSGELGRQDTTRWSRFQQRIALLERP